VDDFEIELKQGFLEEAAQSIVDVEQCFLSLESDPENAENLNKIFRLAHNLKGSSKAVGFDLMGAFTHEFETFILKIKNGQLPATPPVVSLLLRCNDFLSQMVEGYKADLNATFDTSELLQEMIALKDGGSAEPAPVVEEAAVEVESFPTEAAAVETSPENTVEIEPNLELLRELEAQFAGTTEAPAAAAPAPPPPVATKASAPPANTPAAKASPPEETIRISVSKLENLMNYVGEMVILQSVMREQALNSNSMLLKKTVHQLGKVGKEIQDLSMSLRMIPIKPTFQKMQRIVRDTAQAVDKEVNLVLVGEETEIDKTVLEKINDPLVHLIRNSVDHGIENKEGRAAANKGKGTVTLSAFHHAGKLVIEVKDDGAGLNPEKLIKKATEKGILKPGAQLTEREAYQLIFAPGFSTKEQVTDVSGRGVGMDVVKTNITDLSGEISIESNLGQGTTFRILLPLTLAIIDGMTLSFGGEKYIIPLNHVHETLQPNDKQIHKTTAMGDVLILREDNIPIFRLGDFFGKASKLKNHEMIAMVVRTGPKPFALLVDDIIGQSQVVVKQLGTEISGYKGISGSTILGDGKPALILEPQDLLKRKIASVPVPAAPAQAIGGKAA
jgi:two-component system, chemotaxis family, sensor kinase CheA